MKTFFCAVILLTLISVGCENDELLLAPDASGQPDHYDAPRQPDHYGGARRLDYYTESFEMPGSEFQPQTKVQYEYDSAGRVSKYTAYGFNLDSNSLEEQRYFVFSYKSEQVHKIMGYLSDATSPYLEYSYEYLPDGRITKIEEDNHAAGVTSEANFHYDNPNQVIRVLYTYSNGAGFEYEFKYIGENILSDKVTRGSELCSNGQYTYDGHINPFSNLGYWDYTLTNLPVNNRLTENVNHVNCSFPSLVPESYSYEYDAQGYPILAIVNYKSGRNPIRGRKEFFYLDNRQ